MTLTNDRIGDVDLERDRMLVDHAQHGDEAAFSELYLHYHERLYRYCLRRLENRTEAEDAAQEAFARAWKALPNLAGERRFYPWLTVIASNLCVDAARKRSRYAPVPQPELDLLAPSVTGEQDLLVDRSGERDLLSRALGQLSPRHREVLELREGRNWTYQQIAAHSGVEVSTIETLHAARPRRGCSRRRACAACAPAEDPRPCGELGTRLGGGRKGSAGIGWHRAAGRVGIRRNRGHTCDSGTCDRLNRNLRGAGPTSGAGTDRGGCSRRQNDHSECARRCADSAEHRDVGSSRRDTQLEIGAERSL